MKKTIQWIWIALLVFAADRAAKMAAVSLTGRVTLLPGVLGLRYAENTGMAFSLFSGNPWLLGVVSLAVLIAGYLCLRTLRLGTMSRIAAMLILGGAAGNMVDRFSTGYVVDMIEFLFFRFPIFNIADTALVIGCALMALSVLIRPQEWEKRS